MLQIQNYLTNGKSLNDLQIDFGIKSVEHPDLPLVILNYNQIESPKTHPIVREARGLVLNKSDWSLVARSFSRFFNWGEVPEEMSSFDFANSFVQSKEDGSLAVVYFFDNNWHINTRGSFGLDLIQCQSFTWRQAMCKALNINNIDDLKSILDPSLTYVCEFVSPWNKIVRTYKNPQMFLLTAFCGKYELELDQVDKINLDNFVRPKRFDFRSVDEIKLFLKDQEKNDPTFEGVIICDKNFQRWKIKNPSYLSLHKLRGEGDNLYHPRHLLPFVLKNEGDELLTYFPEVKDHYFELKNSVENLFANFCAVWDKNKDILSQKDFALAIKDQTPMTAVLFNVRKKFGNEPTPSEMRKEFIEAQPLILRNLPKNDLNELS